MLTAAANISKFSVVVAIVLHSFFNTSSGLGNALTNGLPRRSREMMIYTFVVLAGGVVGGLAAHRVYGRISLPKISVDGEGILQRLIEPPDRV